MTTNTTSCVDIVSCLLEDHKSLREQLGVLRSRTLPFKDRHEAFSRFLTSLNSHIQAEEEVVISRALEIESMRVDAVKALEEHEVTDFVVNRVKQSADDTQMAARLNVLCDLVECHMSEKENVLVTGIRQWVPDEEREEMGMRYRGVKERNELAPVFTMPTRESLLAGETGKIGYIIAWLLGVPFWILLLVFLIRGH